ncbi:MAG: urea transporter [Bacteroidota bacterium]|nr:urea transporter [Bacteroidota bacterium]
MPSLSKELKANFWLQSLLNSYSLIFFSLNNVLAVVIMIVTFFSPSIGICGLVSVLVVNFIAFFLGYNHEEIRTGTFGFNALLFGLSMGYDYAFNFPFVLLFLTAILVLLLVTSLLKGVLTPLNLPFLSLPFLITYWMVSLSSSNLSFIKLDENHVFAFNELARNESSIWYQIVHVADNWDFFPFAYYYFKTLSGTFFQSSVLGGIMIAGCILYFSRIAFSLSIVGLFSAYFFYSLLGADLNDLNYNLLGANFIFLAISVGCFFLIPNKYSYVAVVVLTPILMLLLMSLSKILGVFQLKAYSLSFSLLCISFLYSLNQRWMQKFLQVTTIQYFSAEKTIYKFLNSIQRFKNEHLYKVSLPFSGEWYVSQGYDGKITHLGDWGKALDFVIVDSKSNTYRYPATSLEHFYCYNKEIIAPFDGYIYDIINNVEDNDVGEVNTEHNWGNTLIMNHLNGLYSQISHIKKDSFKVFIGQYVTKGTPLATCGNSGRSPEPHIHFQYQTVPYVGAKTFSYPISYFIERNGMQKRLHISEVPIEGSHISNVQVNELLVIGFALYPGYVLEWKNEKDQSIIKWEVFTDAWNRTYIMCNSTKSVAYYVYDGVMFYFTDFEGDKSSLLFKYYLAAYRILLGYYDSIEVTDNVPLIHFNNKSVQFFQDFVAPFYLFNKAVYTSKFESADNIYAPQYIRISSAVQSYTLNKKTKSLNFSIELKSNKLKSFSIIQNNKSETYSCVY